MRSFSDRFARGGVHFFQAIRPTTPRLSPQSAPQQAGSSYPRIDFAAKSLSASESRSAPSWRLRPQPRHSRVRLPRGVAVLARPSGSAAPARDVVFARAFDMLRLFSFFALFCAKRNSLSLQDKIRRECLLGMRRGVGLFSGRGGWGGRVGGIRALRGAFGPRPAFCAIAAGHSRVAGGG